MAYSVSDLELIAAKAVNCDIVCSFEEDMTRQEFREECDVNHILRQHGYIPRPVQYGEHDFNADLTEKMQSRSVFQAFYDAAPESVRDRYPDLVSFMAAFGAGAFESPSGGVEPPSGGSTPSEGQQGGEEPPR